jgi:hypothetical protein
MGQILNQRLYTSAQRSVSDLSALITSNYSFNDELARHQIQILDYAYYPTAPMTQRADDDFYLNLRKELISIAATAQGLPQFNPSIREDRQLTAFDALLYPSILKLIPISLYEASKVEFWSYLTLRVVPDLANWRYKNSKSDLEYERHLGMPRNVFRRIWTRSYFALDSSNLLTQMGEDQAVAIFERTAVVSNPKIAVSAVKALAELRKVTQNNEVYRDALKRVRRLKSIESLDVLTQDEVDAKVLEVFVDSLKAIAPGSVI